MSLHAFVDLPTAPPDPAFSVVAAYNDDKAEKKVNLCPRFYRDGNGSPWILPAVTQAKEIIHADRSLDHEHLPLTGHPGLVKGSQNLLFGPKRDLSRLATLQTVSGTGANYIAAQFLSATLGPRRVWISDPSWVNHTEIWKLASPETEQCFYPYYDGENHALNFAEMTETVRSNAKTGDVIILHACAHNPTGADLSAEQWKDVADLCGNLGLFAVFDVAYQGFATGDLAKDAAAITHFFDRGDLEFAIAQSFSKNFGIYGERVGAVHIVARNAATAATITPLITRISRAEITSCPSYGARIVAKILGDETLYGEWLLNVKTMSNRMQTMRKALYDELQRLQVKGSWEHLLSDIGMFSMTGLNKAQVAELRDIHHVYLMPLGRLSVTGLTSQNVSFVAIAFRDILGTIS